MRTDGRTGMMKLIVTFRDLSKSAKKTSVFFFSAEVMFTLSRNINFNINITLSFPKSWQFMKFLGVTLDSGCGLQ
jgi:hypothetical protein